MANFRLFNMDAVYARKKRKRRTRVKVGRQMTVAELIEKLKEMPQDAEVVSASGDIIVFADFDEKEKTVVVCQGA